MSSSWKFYAFSLATTLGVAYIGCAIFDVLFPPYGLLVAFAPHSPMPIFGSPIPDGIRDVHRHEFCARRALWNRVGVLEQKISVSVTSLFRISSCSIRMRPFAVG